MKKLARRSKSYIFSALILAGFSSYMTLPEVLHKSAAGTSPAAAGSWQQSATPQLSAQSPVAQALTISHSLAFPILYDQTSGACAKARTSQNF
jgi:hypothetical protein